MMDDLDHHIEQAMGDFAMPAAAVAVVRGAELIHAKGYGVREVGSDERVDEHTLFQIGSTTKAFTAAALGILVDEGKVGWDDPVCTHVPWFALHDSALTREVSIRDTLAHSTGFIDSIAHVVEILDPDEVLRRMRYRTAFNAFRNSYTYSNLMYALAGKVVEAAAGVSWREFIRTRLLQPLGMNRSGTSPAEYWDAKYIAPTAFGTAPAGSVRHTHARASNVAMPHFWRDGRYVVMPWQSYDSAASAGAIVSSASDLAHWIVLHLNEGRGILRPETLNELHSAQNPHDRSEFPFDPDAGSHALGWRREKYRGETHVAHGGLILGFPAWVAMMPERKIGIAILANGQSATWEMCQHGADPLAFHKRIAAWVFDRLAGLERAPAQRYTGEYADPSGVYGRLSIAIEGDRLVLRFAGEGAYSAFLEHWHQDVFRLVPRGAPWINSCVTFTRTADRLRVFDSDFLREH
jgi:CubicO group peptidase (beta-lactamase class C family)